MKRFIKSLIPPIFLYPFLPKKKAETTYSSYEEALKDCSNSSGYEEDDIVKVVSEKTKLFKQTLDSEVPFEIDATTAYGMFVLNKCLEDTNELNVLDFGGACGLHYFTFRKLLSNKVKLNWAVVETPKMVRYAKDLTNNELSFYDDLNVAAKKMERIDLVFSSGTIQSVPDPVSTLKSLIGLGAEFIFITRLSLTSGSSKIIAKQQTLLSENGIGILPSHFSDKMVEYPHTTLPENEFLVVVESDYKILFKVNESSGIHHVNNKPILGYGVFLKKKVS